MQFVHCARRVEGLVRLCAALGACATTPGCVRPAVLDPAGPAAGRIAELGGFFAAVLGAVYLAVALAVFVSLRRGRTAGAGVEPTLAPDPAAERRRAWAVAAATSLSAVVLAALLLASVRTSRALVREERRDALAVRVTGYQWWWNVRYVDGAPDQHFDTANEIHVPVGRDVRLELAAADVIHSFWLPALNGKRDLIPGRANVLFLRADRPGTYLGQCAEFCGRQHAKMRIRVIAEAPADFEAWRARQRAAAATPKTDAERRGLQVFLDSACALCHAIRGTPAGSRFGPDLTHLASRSQLAANVLPNERAHLTAWVLDAQAAKPGNRMPTLELPVDQLEALIAYLGSLE